MFARVLVSLDDDLLSQDYPLNAKEASDSGRVKDTMRAQCVPQIARHWHEAAMSLRIADPAVAAVSSWLVEREIERIGLGVVVGPTFSQWRRWLHLASRWSKFGHPDGLPSK
jgi:exportin-T